MSRSIISRDSKEYLNVAVTPPAGVTINGQAVSIAVVARNATPTAQDFRPGTWAGTTARVLVGPGELVLAPGVFAVWVKITDNPEVPVLHAGQITVV